MCKILPLPEYACEESWNHEKDLYGMIIKLLEEKNAILEENKHLLHAEQKRLKELKVNNVNTKSEVKKPENFAPKQKILCDVINLSHDLDLANNKEK
ncbi:hypothetical protein JTB14_037940 [Gonioctena quinquepunctata]|nr:hypothetical protein JTB14_037940 [Gonioctena quinquepunctata]